MQYFTDNKKDQLPTSKDQMGLTNQKTKQDLNSTKWNTSLEFLMQSHLTYSYTLILERNHLKSTCYLSLLPTTSLQYHTLVSS